MSGSSRSKEQKTDLSPNKKQFLGMAVDDIGAPLTVEELFPLIDHYQSKLGITIVCNGSTSFGKELLKEKKASILKNLTDKKYFIFFDTESDLPLKKRKFFTEICEKLNKLYTEEARVKTKDVKTFDLIFTYLHEVFWSDSSLLTPEAIAELNSAIERVLPTLSEVQRDGFIEGMNKHIKMKQEEEAAKQVQLFAMQECEKEMKHIQQQLMKNQFVGYIYTSGATSGGAHMEAFIISQDSIVKPVCWPKFEGETRRNLAVCFPANINILIRCRSLQRGEVDANLCPQTSEVECGTLSVVALKKILQNKSLMQDFSLCTNLYSKNINNVLTLQRFFLPPPEVFLYSQSNMYNDIIRLIVSGDQETVVTSDRHDKYTITPLARGLKDTIELAEKKGEQAICQQAKEDLASFLKFREKWLVRFDEINAKRKLMVRTEGGYNEYLRYSAQRMKTIAHLAVANAAGTAVASSSTVVAKSGVTETGLWKKSKPEEKDQEQLTPLKKSI